MKRCILLAGLFLTASTMAETMPYWSWSAGHLFEQDVEVTAETMAGPVSLTDSLDNGYVIEVAVGAMRTDVPVGYEVALAYKEQDDLDIWDLFLNGTYTFNPSSADNPIYGLIGLGLMDVDGPIGDTVWAGQVGAGIRFPKDECTCWDLEYKYLFAEQLKDGPQRANLEHHTLQLGMTYMY